MKNLYKWLIGAVAIVIAICAYKPFDNTINIENVAAGQAYEIGNNSYVMQPVNARGKITGNIDGDAVVVVSDKELPLDVVVTQVSKLKKDEYYPNGHRIYLTKGKINKEFWVDYYKDYYKQGPGHIYYVPLGVKQGNIKINWSI